MVEQFKPQERERFETAIRRFDEANAQDPNLETSEGVPHPRELLYAQRLSNWVVRLCPTASEELHLAARCQHLRRWAIPRDSYPPTRTGYLRWRKDLKNFHAQQSAEILRQVGYPEEVVARVQSLNRKENFPSDPEGRILEDALCLVFLEFQLGELVRKAGEEKVLSALRKTWKKMTPEAHAEALRITYGPKEKALLDLALQAEA